MNMENKSMVYKHYMMVTVISLVLIIVSVGATYAKVDIDRTRVIDLNKFYEIPMNEVKAGDVLNVDLQVTSGGAVDILLMKSSDYPAYPDAINQRGSINYVANGSSTGTTSIKYSYKFKENGDYYLVIDNTDLPKGGGSPMNQVDIKLKVSVVESASTEVTSAPAGVTPVPTGQPQTSQPKTPGFGFILAAIVIVAMVIRNVRIRSP